MNTATKRLIIHEAESTHKYHHKHSLDIRSTRKKNKQTTYKTLGKLEENLSETSGYFTVASCPPMPKPGPHAPNKQGGKPAGQDTSSYMAPQNVSLALHFNNNYNYLDNSPKTYFLEKVFIKARAPRRGIPVSKHCASKSKRACYRPFQFGAIACQHCRRSDSILIIRMRG